MASTAGAALPKTVDDQRGGAGRRAGGLRRQLPTPAEHPEQRADGDRERDATTLAADHVTFRMTWERITRAPEREAARLRAILRHRRAG